MPRPPADPSSIRPLPFGPPWAAWAAGFKEGIGNGRAASVEHSGRYG